MRPNVAERKTNKMVQIDIPAAFIFSQFYLDVGKKLIQHDAAGDPASRNPTYYRFLVRSLVFAGAVIAPGGIYLLSGYPGWEQIYWSSRPENVVFNWVNALIPALFVALIVGGGYLGHYLGYRWVVQGKIKLLRASYLGVLAVVAVVVLSCYPSWTLMGTYHQYHHNRSAMTPVWQNPHGFSIAWILVMVCFTSAALYLLIKTLKEAKKVG